MRLVFVLGCVAALATGCETTGTRGQFPAASTIKPSSVVSIRLTAYRKSSRHGAAMRFAAIRELRRLRMRCANEKRIKFALLHVYRAPTFTGEASAPTSGTWSERVLFPGCKAPPLNFLLVANPGTKIRLTILPPGTTGASVQLQVGTQAALRIQLSKANLGPARCPASQVIGTRIVSKDPVNRVYREIWTVRACEQIVRFRVRYSPALGGKTAITVSRAR